MYANYQFLEQSILRDLKMIQHKHLIVRAEVNSPPPADQKDLVRDDIVQLVSDLGMKILSGPHVEYVNVPGNAGMTAVCIIETSHIAMHVWDEVEPALLQLDVYSCSSLDEQIVFDWLEFFDPVRIEYKYLDREHFLQLVKDGTLEKKEGSFVVSPGVEMSEKDD